MTRTNALIRTAFIAAGLVLVNTGAANAQLQETMKFKTTFPFVVSGKTLPAGAYTATPLPGDPGVLRITNGRNGVILMTEREEPKVPPRRDEVTFIKRGDTYMLSEIWDAADSVGVEPIPAAHGDHAVRQMKGK
jgi:hypothetical protein